MCRLCEVMPEFLVEVMLVGAGGVDVLLMENCYELRRESIQESGCAACMRNRMTSWPQAGVNGPRTNAPYAGSDRLLRCTRSDAAIFRMAVVP